MTLAYLWTSVTKGKYKVGCSLVVGERRESEHHVMMRACTVILLLCVGSSLQVSTPESPSYEAGVVEFNYEIDAAVTPAQRTATSLAEYLKMMEEAPANLDIIIFPEMTLNGMETAVTTPEPEDMVSPCDNTELNSNDLVKQISCSAKKFNRYVVVDIVTQAACPDAEMIANNDPRNCTERDDGLSYYNTNVVFDRSGTLISRYRKFNLFGEPVDKPFKPTMVSFDTDFGVRFGHFICFDLMFREPALELVRNGSITDFVFTTMWFSEMPFLTAVQVQQNWAYSNNVNLLAAGANNPGFGSTGTGVYAGKMGSLVSVMVGASSSKLYTATVPKTGRQSEVTIVESSIKYNKEAMKSLKLKRDQLDKYKVSFLPTYVPPGSTIIQDVCHGDLCCNFNYNISISDTENPNYRYALAAYHGNRTFDGFADGGVLACAIFACKDLNIESCGVRDETLGDRYEWHSIEITGKFPYGDEYFYLPSTLDESIMPFSVKEFTYKQRIESFANDTYKETSTIITMSSVGPVRNFYTFGIYGRDFNLDALPAKDEDDKGGAGYLNISSFLVLLFSAVVTAKNLNKV